MRKSRCAREVATRALRAPAWRQQLRGLATTSGDGGKQVAVVGGGLTGLATAYLLAKQLPPSARITLYEAGSRLGGWIRTDRERVNVGGVRGVVPFERGPRTLSSLRGNTWRYDDLVLYELMLDLGLTPSYPKDLPRYLYYPDHLVTMPPDASVFDCLREPLFRECFRGALGTAAGYVTGRHRGALPAEDLSVADWLRLVTGDAVVGRNLVSAMIHGIYGGDIERLSARSVLDRMYYALHLPPAAPGHRHVPAHELAFMERRADDDLVCAMANRPKGALVHFGAQGMEALPKALENALSGQANVTIRRDTPVTDIAYLPQEERVQVTTSQDAPQLFDHVISTSSSHTLVKSTGSALSALAEIESVSIMTVNLWYPTERMKPPGFGYLIPRAVPAAQNPERALGVFFDSDVAGERAPDEPAGTKLFVLMGGHYYAGDGSAAPPPSEDEAVAQAKALLERHLGIPRDTPCHAMARLARDCIPQHNVGHVARLRRAHEQMTKAFGGRLVVANGSYGRIGAMGALRNADGAAHAVVSGQRVSGLEDFICDPVIADVPLAQIPCRQPQRKA
ncbi:protoporphyrinogen oxidase [Cordyceps militaris CM01]|uniref:Protoporphyrinogen oxidase n=1 Tax=Cordyceps militaris (strain CM01) TaxID=983644 RepID=G3JLJ1_CORMM|nr:protoporphyrinogen oxidase [Cordyceps militaris CM01]EGX90565.1 protoporphyrinogen oxidase [Cordyceps militaris CM01]